MGHAAMLAVEDILVRFERMRGKKTLWLPGTDSAAIATQSKVEKEIQKSEGKSRHDLGREELLKRIEQFTDESKDYIINQLRRMGSSLDWSPLRLHYGRAALQSGDGGICADVQRWPYLPRRAHRELGPKRSDNYL
jgi:valyl-tRNA synthetase